MREALPREEVIKAVEHRGPVRVPMMLHQWNDAETFGDRADAVRAIQAQYPQDWCLPAARMPAQWDDRSDPSHIPGYSWFNTPPPPPNPVAHGLDAEVGIADWAQLDGILAEFPDPTITELFADQREFLKANAAGRYTGIH